MNWTLEQLKSFVTTVEKGSFSAASRSLGKAQSRISTAVANLEIDIGFELFDRSGRYPVLTSHGQAIYDQATAILGQCERFDSQARTLTQGEEIKIALALDDAIPMESLEEFLFELNKRFPKLSLTLLHGTHGDVSKKVESLQADIGLVTEKSETSKILELQHLCLSQLVLVVGAGHPLVSVNSPSSSQLAKFRQYVVCDKEGKAYQPPISSDCWYVDSYYFALLLIARGDGWTLLPEYLIAQELHRVDLVCLSSEKLGQSLTLELSVIQRRSGAKGPVNQWIVNELKNTFN